MQDIQIVILAFASVLGALTAASLGWLESGEPFNGRTFTSSILRAIIAGIISAGGFSTIVSPAIWDYITAFLAGVAIDVGGNRIAGAISARKATTTTSPATTAPATPTPA
jgi:hypothetical protein